jgi:hypothetical protein
VGVSLQNLAQVHLAQDLDMINAFTPDRSDEPFN